MVRFMVGVFKHSGPKCPLGGPLLIIKPAEQFVKRHHDMLSKCRPLLEQLIPSLNVRYRGSDNIQVEITIRMGAQRYIGKRQKLATYERLSAQELIQALKKICA